jgi:hypothetical protein
VAQSRKRRKERQRAAGAATRVRSQAPGEGERTHTPEPAPVEAAPPSGYSRSRAKDDAARAALKPLAPGERPTAVTVGAIVAVALAVANVIAMIVGWDSLGGDTDEGRAAVFTVVWSVILLLVAWGMWRSRYWAVLGMQTLLAITLVLASLALIGAGSAVSAIVLVLILVAAGTLFWFMVKAMARIQMPERPSRAR